MQNIQYSELASSRYSDINKFTFLGWSTANEIYDLL